MTTTRAVVLAVLLAVCGLAIAPFATGAVVDGDDRDLSVDSDDDLPEDTSEPEDEDDNEDEDRPMGSEVSAFMQASSANTEDAVESKRFETDYDNADEDARADVTSHRIDRLEDRIADIEEEREQLREQKADDDINPVAYDARMSRLAAQIDALDRAIEGLENRSGVDDERLEELRTGAGTVAGPDVAAAASGLSVVDPPRGPPEGTPGGSDGSQSSDGEQPAQANGPQAPENELSTDPGQSDTADRSNGSGSDDVRPDHDDSGGHQNADESGSGGPP